MDDKDDNYNPKDYEPNKIDLLVSGLAAAFIILVLLLIFGE